jgi:hypothetical protein
MLFDNRGHWPWIWAVCVLGKTTCGDGGQITRGEMLELGKEVV